MNLEDRIRNAIDHETEASTEPGVPEGLIRRARRRIAVTVASATLAVAVVGGGGFAVVRSLQSDGGFLPGDMPTPPAPTLTAPSPTPTVPVTDPAEAFVRDFMQSRVEGSGAEAFLSPEAATYYESLPPGVTPRLYGGGTEEAFGEYEVIRNPRDDGAIEFTIRVVVIPIGDSPACPVTESLLLGPGTSVEGSDLPLVIRHAEYVVGGGWDLLGLTSLGAQEFVCAFMEARLAGPGPDPDTLVSAEYFLSEESRGQYDRGEGGLELFPSQDHAGFWWIVDSAATEQGVYVTLTLNNTGQPDAIYEYLLVGHDGADGPTRVLSAERIPCDQEHPCGSE